MIVSAVEARNKFGELLSRVHLYNEEITIERAGKKIAKLVSLDSPGPENAGLLKFSSARGLGAEIWKDLDADHYVAEERREWD